MDFESIKADDIHSIATLSSTPKYQETLRLVDEEVAQHGDAMPDSWAGPSDADPTYRLIVTCNELAMSVDDEIAKTYAFIKQKCAANFPVNQLMQSAVKLIQVGHGFVKCLRSHPQPDLAQSCMKCCVCAAH